MKLVGKVLLLIASIVYLIWAVYGIVDAWDMFVSAFTSVNLEGIGTSCLRIVTSVVMILGGVGGISRFIGIGPFKGWVFILSVIILVLIICELILGIVNTGNLFYTSSGTLIAVLYLVGYLMSK
ncbi:MAG: hypothetical protein Q4F15_03395 [Bacillota bacterium]|nr:hypothetical protein [Bacillota bacterium]